MNPLIVYLYPLAAGLAAVLVLRLPLRLLAPLLAILAGAAALPVLVSSIIR